MDHTLMDAMLAGAATAFAAMSGAHPAELKVLGGGAMAASLSELGPMYERKTGNKVSIAFGATPDLIKLATSGDHFDLAVAPVDVLKNDAARAKFSAETSLTIARVGFGVAVRAGTAKPDISTPDKLKAALLKAQSVSTLPASAAGTYVLKVFERLGIADAMKAKIKAQPAPGDIPKAVANGEAELAVFLINVLMAPGVELAGPFPGDLQQDLVFFGALSTGTKEATAAKAFLDYLKTPEAVAVFKAKGVTPG